MESSRMLLPRMLIIALLGSLGCQSWITRKKEEPFQKEARRIRELMADPDRPRLVGEIASALGLTIRRYDSLALISNLPGTGGILRPGNHRQFMMEELRRHEVLNPEAVIDSPATATAKIRIYANPGDTKGDVIDVLVESTDESNATDLREGYLMPATLREYLFLDGRNRSSNEKATASGEVVILPPSLAGSAELNPLRGVIIGGGKLLEAPKLGIRVDKDYRHVMVVRSIEKAINRRFFYQDASRLQTVATGKNDWHIVIETVPKYRWDPMHYMSTVLAIGFGESKEQVDERLAGCRRLLVQRETTRRAACELEAIGSPEAAEVLLEGLGCLDTEVRFHAAYSLAYLDRPECVPVLQNLAITEPAFRPLCLIGLAVNEHPSARDALNDLLQEAEPETRYGALLAIRQKNMRDPAVIGDTIGDVCNLIQIPSKIPLVVVSMEQKKEIVLYGGNAAIDLPGELSPTPSLRLVPLAGGLIRIAKRQSDGEMLQGIIANDLQSLLRALPSVEGNYGDVVHILDQLGQKGYISIPVAINPRPRAGRIYKRDQDGTEESVEELESIQVDGASHATNPSKRSWMQFASWPSLGLGKKAETNPDFDEGFEDKSRDGDTRDDDPKDEEGTP